MQRSLLVQAWILFGILLANFLAQGVYFWHLYYSPQHPFPDLRSALMLGSVLLLLLVGYALFIIRRRSGYALLVLFLALDFGFYLWNIIGGALHGYGWFFQLRNPDSILWVVFAIGYLNFFASGYFLWLLLSRRRQVFGPAVV